MRSVGVVVEKREFLYIVQKNGNLYSYQGNKDEGFFKNLKIELLYDLVMFFFFGCVFKGNEISILNRYLYFYVYFRIIDSS